MSRRLTGPLFIALSAVLAVAAVSGCSSSASKGSSATNAQASSTAGNVDLSGVTLNFGDQGNAIQDLAKDSGAFENLPYKINWDEFKSGATLFQAVRGGSTDAQYASDLTTAQAISGGVKVRFVAAQVSDGSGTSIVVSPSAGVKTVADLKGKTIALSSAPGGISQYLLANVLQQAGLTFSDVKVQYLPFVDGQAAFSTHQISVWGTNGIYALTAINQGGKLLVDGKEGRTSGLAYVSASPSTLANPGKKAALADFLNRLAKADAWAVDNTDTYVQDYAKSKSIPLASAKVVISEGLGYLLPVSAQLSARSQKVSDLMSKLGQLPVDVQFAPLVDTSVFPTALPGTPADGLPAAR